MATATKSMSQSQELKEYPKNMRTGQRDEWLAIGSHQRDTSHALDNMERSLKAAQRKDMKYIATLGFIHSHFPLGRHA